MYPLWEASATFIIAVARKERFRLFFTSDAVNETPMSTSPWILEELVCPRDREGLTARKGRLRIAGWSFASIFVLIAAFTVHRCPRRREQR